MNINFTGSSQGWKGLTFPPCHKPLPELAGDNIKLVFESMEIGEYNLSVGDTAEITCPPNTHNLATMRVRFDSVESVPADDGDGQQMAAVFGVELCKTTGEVSRQFGSVTQDSLVTAPYSEDETVLVLFQLLELTFTDKARARIGWAGPDYDSVKG